MLYSSHYQTSSIINRLIVNKFSNTEQFVLNQEVNLMRNSDSLHTNPDYTAKDLDDDSSHLNGAMFIDENGEEVPITEEMIQQACKDLLEAIK